MQAAHTYRENVLTSAKSEKNACRGYRFLFNGKEIDNEVYGDNNSYDFGARLYDPRLGRWLAVEPLSAKYPMLSAYAFSANSPIRFVDIDGKDWFVNTKTGEVIYIKNEKQITAKVLEVVNGLGSTNPNDFERLGPNNMFGNKITYGGEDNQLNRSSFSLNVKQSEQFMGLYGYFKTQQTDVEEWEFSSGGPIDHQERVTQVNYTIEKLSDGKIGYHKSSDIGKKTNYDREESKGKYSSIITVRYTVTKKFDADIRETADFYGNRSTVGKNTKPTLGFIKESVEILKGVLKKSK